jgi:hypothetical protein
MIHSDEEEVDLVLHVILLLCLIKQHNDYRGNRDNISRSAILSSKLSPWRHLLDNADEASFPNYTGFSRFAFSELHKALFTEEELERERDARLVGRPKDLTTKDEVGLYLFYVSSRMRQKDLGDIFGIIPIKTAGLQAGSTYVEFGGTLQNQERMYFGPVNIHRMTIRLLNDRGDLVDLNNTNWSFSLVCEQLYKQTL